MPGIDGSCQIIGGESDPIPPVENAHILHRRLPENRLNILNEKGHYAGGKVDGVSPYRRPPARWRLFKSNKLIEPLKIKSWINEISGRKC
jgi:hypothetical protein